MVTGRRAFAGESKMSILSDVLHQEPAPVEGVPQDLERIMTLCLRKAPDRRHPNMKDLTVELEELKEESDSGMPAVAALGSARPRHRSGWDCMGLCS
jgi:eukaryotic-like serine/threonine-protein kinase